LSTISAQTPLAAGAGEDRVAFPDRAWLPVDSRPACLKLEVGKFIGSVRAP
jgi:hypothetical protein